MLIKLLVFAFFLLQPVFSISPSSTEAIALPTTEVTSPQKTSDSLGIKLTAKSAIVLDRKSKATLFEKNVNQQLSMASLTKIMTVAVVLENTKNFDDIVTVSKKAVSLTSEDKDIKLKEGEQMSVNDLLHATLMASANDAAQALAEYQGPGLDKFVEKMNKKAQELNLKNTHFADPTGLNEKENWSSSYDLARLFDYLLENETVKNILVTKDYTIKSANTSDTHYFKNTNELLSSFLNIKGGKTGFTDQAGYCLIEVAESQGNQIIAVVLGSESDETRFQETKSLLDWAFRNYKWK